MNPLGRATPDSEAVASSEDERPWPSAPVFGMMPRKENGVPGLGGGIWSQKRGSFKMEKAAHRNAAKEARLAVNAASHAALRAGNTPSPAASEGSAALPFAIPLQPTPKVHRSLSHSQGQRDFSQLSSAHFGSNGGREGGALPLGLLTEEDVDTETESELGTTLTQTASHPYALQRTSTLPAAAFGSYFGGHAYSEDPETDSTTGALSPSGERGNGYGDLSRRSQWQSHLGWEDLPNVNESRRHSLAELPTRRGSLVAAAASGRDAVPGARFLSPTSANYDEWDGLQRDHNTSETHTRADTLTNSQLRYPDDDIPENYRAPHIQIADYERSAASKQKTDDTNNMKNFGGNLSSFGMNGGFPFRANYMANFGNGYGHHQQHHGRPRRQLFVISFKCSRVDVFYLLENTGLQVREGDIVIVEADRGQDLGTVQHANVTEEEAKIYKKKYGEEQYRWLMMFSQNNHAGNVNPNAQQYGENHAARASLINNAPPTMQGAHRENATVRPKAIKRLANAHEIGMLRDKEGNEAKAKRACQQKVAHLGLDMEILDAEWQWDFQKLIFYYYAEHYINFKDLITELYRIYKTRIWMSAINPASFSQSAIGQPPSGIGPGAVSAYQNSAGQYINNAYQMSYGQDPDPYGAVPPYHIGYETYTPNYPAIPGVANSFPGYAHPAGGAFGGVSAAHHAGAPATTTANTGGGGPLPPWGPAGAGAGPGFRAPFGFGAQPPVGTRPPAGAVGAGRAGTGRGGSAALVPQFGDLSLSGGASPRGSSVGGGVPLPRGEGGGGRGGR